LDEDDARVDGADLFFELGPAVRGDLCPQDDEVDSCHVELPDDFAKKSLIAWAV
jgi:hypothetical protein